MTAVLLSAIFLNDAADPSDFMAFPSAGEAISLNTEARIEVRQLANRKRLIRKDTRTYETVSVTFPRCSPAQVAWLKAHVGQLVCVRDHVGNKLFCAYGSLPRDVDTSVRDRADVKLDLSEISHSEAV